MIKNRIIPCIELYYSKFQAGGKQNRSTVDNLFLLTAVIDHAAYRNSSIILTLYDFKTCFDSLWLEDCLNVLWDARIQNELFSIIYQLNKTCCITAQTPFGPTDQLMVENLVKQGTVLGPILCGTSVSDYCKLEANPYSGFYIGHVEVRSLGFMDDLNDINTNITDVVNSNDMAVHFESIKRLRFSADKCEIIKIGNHCEALPKLTINREIVKEKEKIKYLSDFFNSKGSNTALINERVTAMISVTPDLIAMGKEISLGNYETEILLILYNAVFLNKLLFNCQSWSKLTKNDLRQLEMKQLELFKHIMEVPHTTSNIGMFLELRLLPK